MADNEKSLDILIRTKAELAGAQAFTQEIERALGKAKALGNVKEIEELSKQLKTAKAAIAESAISSKNLAAEMGVVTVSQEDINKILGEGTEAAEINKRQMSLLARALGSEVPGGAAVLESAFTMLEGKAGQMMGATFLLVGGLELLKNALEKIHAEEEESNRIEEKVIENAGEHTKAVEKQSEALERAEVAEAIFHHNLIRNTRDAVNQAATLAKALMDANRSAFTQHEDSSHSAAMAEVEAMEQRGVVSHETAVQMKEQIDLAYHQRKVAMMIAEDRLEMNILANQLTAKSVGLRKDESDETAAQNKFKDAAAAKAGNDARIEEAQKKISSGEETKKALRDTGVTEENIQKLRESYESVSGKPGQGKDAVSLSEMFTYLSRHAGGLVPRQLFGTQGDRNLALYEGAEIDIKAGKSDLARAKAKAPDLEIAAGNAQSDLESARSSLQKNRDQVRELQDKTNELRATNAIKEGSAINNLGMDLANSRLTADRGIADRLQRGESVSGADAEKMRADASTIAGHQVDLKTAAQIIEHGANDLGAFMGQLNRLSIAFSKLNPGKIGEMQRQIDDLATQVSRVAEAAWNH